MPTKETPHTPSHRMPLFVLGGVLGGVLAMQLGCGVNPEDVRTDYAPLPEAANGLASVVFGDHLYVHGGHVGSAHDQSRDHTLDQFIRLDLTDTNAAWESLQSPGEHVQQSSLFEVDGDMYRLGGMTSLNPADEDIEIWTLDVFEKYDAATDSWSAMPTMPDTRASHSLTVVDGVIYIIGGWTLHGASGSGVYSDTWMSFDLKDDAAEWQTHEQPFQIRDLCSGTVDGKVYVLGGMLSGAFPTEPWVLDTETLTWERGPDVPVANVADGFTGGFGCGATSHDDTIFYNANDVLYRLNDARDGWTEVAQLEAPRIFHQLVVNPSANELLLVGGGVGSDVTPLDSVEAVSLDAP